MNKTVKKIGWLLFRLIIAITFISLAVSIAGLIFDYPHLYSNGLKGASLIFIVILPACIILVALTPVALCLTMADVIKNRRNKN